MTKKEGSQLYASIVQLKLKVVSLLNAKIGLKLNWENKNEIQDD